MNNNKTMWGTHAGVDIIDNGVCEKVYTEQTLISIKDHVISPEVFNIIKELNLDTFVKLYDYNYDTTRGQIISYTMEYYPSNGKDIMTIDTSYIYNSFVNIYKDVIALTKKGILIGDMNFSNIIFGDIIKVIDFDNYKVSDMSYEKTLENNLKELCYAFKGIYKIAIYDEYSRSGYIHYGIENLMELFDPKQDNLPLHINKRILKYNDMLSYFKDRK